MGSVSYRSKALLAFPAFVLAACGARSAERDPRAPVVLETTPEQARAVAVDVLQEAGFQVEFEPDERQVVASTGGNFLRQTFMMCPKRQHTSGYYVGAGHGTNGRFMVRFQPRDGAVRLTFGSRFEASECPSQSYGEREPGQPQIRACTKIVCDSSGELERRIVERIRETGAS